MIVTFERIADALASVTRPHGRVVRSIDEGAYSRSSRWIVEWPDGRSAFVKAGLYPDLTRGLALEEIVYSSLDQSCHPTLLGWHPGNADAGDPAVLVIEDLSHAHWGTPVTHADAQQLSAALDAVAACTASESLPILDPAAPHLRHEWAHFARDPAALLATGFVDGSWFDLHASKLARVESRAILTGDGLVHGDLWRQNWCNLQHGAVLVDWSSASRGNPVINRAWGECGVRAAGGPHGVVFPHDSSEPEWATWMCGRAFGFAIESADDDRVRLVETTRREARAALDWMCSALALPLPAISKSAQAPRSWRP